MKMHRALIGLVVVGVTGCGGVVDTEGAATTEYKNVVVRPGSDSSSSLTDGNLTTDFSCLKISGEDTVGTVREFVRHKCCDACICNTDGQCTCTGCVDC